MRRLAEAGEIAGRAFWGERRRRDSVRAGARGRFESAVADSCGVRVERRGAKQELSWRKPFDDMHGSAANRAVPE